MPIKTMNATLLILGVSGGTLIFFISIWWVHKKHQMPDRYRPGGMKHLASDLQAATSSVILISRTDYEFMFRTICEQIADLLKRGISVKFFLWGRGHSAEKIEAIEALAREGKIFVRFIPDGPGGRGPDNLCLIDGKVIHFDEPTNGDPIPSWCSSDPAYPEDLAWANKMIVSALIEGTPEKAVWKCCG